MVIKDNVICMLNSSPECGVEGNFESPIPNEREQLDGLCSFQGKEVVLYGTFKWPVVL